MKKFITIGMFVFLGICVTLMPQIVQGCEIYDYSKTRVMELDCAINKLNEENYYKHNMEYYVGYLNGQRQAFYEVKTLIDNLYPN